MPIFEYFFTIKLPGPWADRLLKTKGGPMKSFQAKYFIIISIIAQLSLGCGKQLENLADSSNCTENCDNIKTGDQIPLTPDELYKDIDLEGKVNGGNYDQHMAIRLDKEKNAIVLMMPLGMNPFIGQLEGQIPELKGTQFTTVQDNQGQIYWAISIPLEHIVKGGKFTDNVSKLPNGDPLPAVAGGELPSIGIDIRNSSRVKGQLYLGKSVVGIFVSSQFNPYISLTQPIKNKAKTQIIGYFSTVPEKNGFDGGFFMTFIMPPKIAEFLDQHLIIDP